MRWLLALSAVVVALLHFQPAVASEVVDFGGNQQRQFRSEAVGWSTPIGGWNQAPSGASMSQPLIVGDRLYVLSGDDLHLYDATALRNGLGLRHTLVATFSQANGRGLNGGYASFSHVAFSVDNNALYVGTGRRTVAALHPTSLRLLGETPDLGSDLVGAPLVFPGDVTVASTREGYISVVQGLKMGLQCRAGRGTECIRSRRLGGDITASATRRGTDSFILATDGPGEIVALQLELNGATKLLSEAWTERLIGLAGIPDSAAVDGHAAYLADKPGVFYKLSKDSGTLLAPPLSDGFPRSFYNASPSIGDRYVYFTRRGDDDQGNGDGYLVAVDKASWKVAWKAKLPGQGNTSPLFWKHAGLVLVGDVEGYVTGWDAETGEPKPWAVEADGNQKVQAFRVTSLPQKDPALAWTHLQGVGTEISIANGLLVLGANSPARQGDSNAVRNRLTGAWLSGVLFVAHTSYAANVSLADGKVEPSPAAPDAEIDLTAVAKYDTHDPKALPLTTEVAWRWQGETAWRGRAEVTIPPNGGVPVRFRVMSPAGSATAELMINPERVRPPWETRHDDNLLRVPVPIAAPSSASLPNIQVELEVPLEVPAGTRFPVSVVVIHDLPSETDVDVSFRANAGAPTGTQARLSPRRERHVVFELTAGEAGRITVTGCANESREIHERDYTDNCQSTDFPVTPNPAIPAPDRIRVRLVQ